MEKEQLNELYDRGFFSDLDFHFARFVSGLAGEGAPELFLAAALLSRARGQGHVCLDLCQSGGRPLDDASAAGFICPKADAWCDKLEKYPVIGAPGAFRPLILDQKYKLYLHRYWEYQERLAAGLNNRVSAKPKELDPVHLKNELARLFPVPHNHVDWQKIAAVTAFTKRFCVISGGPGTGKTTTVAKIIVLHLAQATGKTPRIALAAPTGKAAASLQEALKGAKAALDYPKDIKENLSQTVATIHRLLEPIPGTPYFRYNARNPLPADMVIVDEASMVDMALMSKLVQALHPRASLILLGDKDQLASVEAGAVLGDICDAGNNSEEYSTGFIRELETLSVDTKGLHRAEKASGIWDAIVILKKSYRFDTKSGINALSRAVNAGDPQQVHALFKSNQYDDIVLQDLPEPVILAQALKKKILIGFQDYLKTIDPAAVSACFGRFRILCAIRGGPYGVSELNLLAEHVLKQAGILNPDQIWYQGRPVLITQNDYHLGLFNGDVGLILPDPASKNALRAFFPKADGGFKALHPLRLPKHETVFAMTVHRSQGSEFDKVLLMLPPEDVPILTREMIYTGITRTRKHIEIWCKREILDAAIQRKTQRTSGLRDALWEQPHR